MINVRLFVGTICVLPFTGCGDTCNSNADIEKVTASLSEQQCSVASDNIVETLNVDEDEFRVVDMGLSVKWASCNLGANKPEQFGNYYAWGELKKRQTTRLIIQPLIPILFLS